MPSTSSQPIVFRALQELAAEAPVSLRVTGDCMNPALPDGCQVQVACSRIYWPGDVLAFRSSTGQMRIHRLIGYRPFHPDGSFQTRADASGMLDQPFGREQLIGKVVGSPLGWQVRFGDRARAALRFLKLGLLRLLPA